MVIESAVICLAMNIYFEARGETNLGQLAVANVTINRARQNKTKICEEVFKPHQFSWTTTKTKIVNGIHRLLHTRLIADIDAWHNALVLARAAMKRGMPDFTHGATFYHADYVSPSWAAKMKRTVQIGRHIFYKLA